MKLIAPAVLLLMAAGGPRPEAKIPCYAWLGGPKQATDAQLLAKFADLKKKGIDGILYSAGHDPETYRRVGKAVKAAGMEFEAWIPTLVQEENPKLKHEWYAVNGLGQSAFDKPAYVDHYKFLCPNREEVFLFLADLYGRVAAVPEVDGIHLDFIRFPDVILARGLWEKYGLVMDREFPQFDYCYCDKCVADFKAESGIDIKAVEDPSTVEAWKQFRYDLITNLVSRLAKEVRARNKRITAAVFPGPGFRGEEDRPPGMGQMGHRRLLPDELQRFLSRGDGVDRRDVQGRRCGPRRQEAALQRPVHLPRPRGQGQGAGPGEPRSGPRRARGRHPGVHGQRRRRHMPVHARQDDRRGLGRVRESHPRGTALIALRAGRIVANDTPWVAVIYPDNGIGDTIPISDLTKTLGENEFPK